MSPLLQNRVTPLGDLITSEERGLVYGNRGCLHSADGVIRRSDASRRWIACRLEFRGRRRTPLMSPGRYTELFFLDEATALAAGHRPCAECRRKDYNRLTEIWAELHPGSCGADAIDAQLHAERLELPARTRRFHDLSYDELPDGAFVLHRGSPCLVLGAHLHLWSPGGYLTYRRRPATGTATTITPPSLMDLLRYGWTPVVPLVHPTASDSPSGRR
jgi:hypothetical protein